MVLSFFNTHSMAKGEPPARVLPLFVCDENSPSPALSCARGISASADADQGLCPWTPVTFFVKKVTQKA